MIELLIALGVGGYGYMKSRKFVREKLRFVEAAHRRGMPIIAGVITGLGVGAIAWALPIIGGLTAVLAGCGVGFGILQGSKDTRRLTA